jgi:hypothetical protein
MFWENIHKDVIHIKANKNPFIRFRNCFFIYLSYQVLIFYRIIQLQGNNKYGPAANKKYENLNFKAYQIAVCLYVITANIAGTNVQTPGVSHPGIYPFYPLYLYIISESLLAKTGNIDKNTKYCSYYRAAT